ncbi:MAG: hypothetical protein SF339_12995 [Blastocatellia bacterium]|nr:hypothetical protein [Blastocatellia bacterium]
MNMTRATERRIVPAIALACVVTMCAFAVNAQEGRRGGPGGFGPEGGFMRFHPVLVALDADANGAISADELAQAAAKLKGLDKNNDGQLTAEELRPAGRGGRGPGERERAPGNNAEEMVKTLMEFDGNNDGKLSKDEVPERLQGLFERGDANKDGALTREELKVAAEAQAAPGGAAGREGRREGRPGGRGGPGAMQRGNPVQAALDADNDGAISTAEIENAPAALRKLDRNGDGQLTEEEVRPGPGPGEGGNRPRPEGRPSIERQ